MDNFCGHLLIFDEIFEGDAIKQPLIDRFWVWDSLDVLFCTSKLQIEKQLQRPEIAVNCSSEALSILSIDIISNNKIDNENSFKFQKLYEEI